MALCSVQPPISPFLLSPPFFFPSFLLLLRKEGLPRRTESSTSFFPFSFFFSPLFFPAMSREAVAESATRVAALVARVFSFFFSPRCRTGHRMRSDRILSTTTASPLPSLFLPPFFSFDAVRDPLQPPNTSVVVFELPFFPFFSSSNPRSSKGRVIVPLFFSPLFFFFFFFFSFFV